MVENHGFLAAVALVPTENSVVEPSRQEVMKEVLLHCAAVLGPDADVVEILHHVTLPPAAFLAWVEGLPDGEHRTFLLGGRGVYLPGHHEGEPLREAFLRCVQGLEASLIQRLELLGEKRQGMWDQKGVPQSLMGGLDTEAVGPSRP